MKWDSYEKKFYGDPDDILLEENNHLVSTLQALGVNGKNCLDFGCGTGYWAEVLIDLGARVVGTDISSSAISYCQSKYPQSKFVLLKDEGLPFSDQFFDAIVITWVFQEITVNRVFLQVIQDLNRILKRKGNLVLVDNFYSDKRILQQETKYGDLFLNDKNPEILRFFKGNTLVPIMSKFLLLLKQRSTVGHSFYEIYTK